MPIFTPKETADNMELIRGKISGLNYGKHGCSRGIPGTPEQVQEALLSLIEPQCPHRVHDGAKEHINELKKLMSDRNEAAIYGIITPEKFAAFKTMVIFCISEKIYELGQASTEEKRNLETINQERETRNKETSSQINARRQNGSYPNPADYCRPSPIDTDMRDSRICRESLEYACMLAPFIGFLMVHPLSIFLFLTGLNKKVSEETLFNILIIPVIIGALASVFLGLLILRLNIRDFFSDLRKHADKCRLTATQPSLFRSQTMLPNRNSDNNNVERPHNRGR
jgi:hypothetical protein